MQKEILHIVNLDTVGGVEELFCNFIQYPNSDRNHVFVTGGKVHPYFEDVVYQYCASVNYEKYFFGMKIPKWIRQMRRNYVLSKEYSHIVLWNRFDKISNPAKVIYYEHGASWIHHKGKIEREFFDSISHILANSHAAKRLLELKWKVTKPITVIENPLRGDVHPVAQGRTHLRTPLRLGCIGRLISLKGFALAIHALAELLKKGHKAELSIAGDGEEREKLKALAKGLPVTFLGPIQDVESFYDSIDLLLIPSIREPLGLVALEAEARGVPVIAANIDGLPEAVAGTLLTPTLALSSYRDFGGELKKLPDLVYDPVSDTLSQPKILDPVELAAAIISLTENKQKYQDASKQALEFAKKRTSIEDFSEKLLTFL